VRNTFKTPGEHHPTGEEHQLSQDS